MNKVLPTHREAAIAAVRYAEVFGLWALVEVLEGFGVNRIGELDERLVPAFVARVWTGPRFRRIK